MRATLTPIPPGLRRSTATNKGMALSRLLAATTPPTRSQSEVLRLFLDAVPSRAATMADALRLTEESDGEWAGAPVAASTPASAGCASIGGLATSHASQQLPGPIGALADSCASSNAPQSQLQRPSRFRKSAAWLQLEAAVKPGDAQTRMTVQQVLEKSCGHPKEPVIVPLLFVLIQAIAQDSGGAEDIGVVLADETAEMSGSLHPEALSDYPGALVTGTALALRQVPVLSLAAHSHVLVIAPHMLAYAVSPGASSTIAGPCAHAVGERVRASPPPPPRPSAAPTSDELVGRGPTQSHQIRHVPLREEPPEGPRVRAVPPDWRAHDHSRPPHRPPHRDAPRQPAGRPSAQPSWADRQMPSPAEVARRYAEVARGESVARQRLDRGGGGQRPGSTSGVAWHGRLEQDLDMDEEAELWRLDAGGPSPEGSCEERGGDRADREPVHIDLLAEDEPQQQRRHPRVLQPANRAAEVPMGAPYSRKSSYLPPPPPRPMPWSGEPHACRPSPADTSDQLDDGHLFGDCLGGATQASVVMASSSQASQFTVVGCGSANDLDLD